MTTYSVAIIQEGEEKITDLVGTVANADKRTADAEKRIEGNLRMRCASACLQIFVGALTADYKCYKYGGSRGGCWTK